MITYIKEAKTFYIQTINTTYCISIADKGYVTHTYYGSRINDEDVSYLTRQYEYYMSQGEIFREKHTLLDFLPQELPADGLGDFRQSAIAISDSKNRNGVDLMYKDYKITKTAPEIPDLPHVFGKNAETLEIITEDKCLGIEVSLFYTIFDDNDAIVRSTKIKSVSSKEPVYIKKALSLAFDMDNEDFNVITLHGSWARERHIERHQIHKGIQGVCSMRGETSHQEHPFIAILDKNTDNNSGRVYGINFIYSGNFTAAVQYNQFDSIRTVMGINPDNFCWKLNPGEEFYTPQAVITFTQNGLNAMSHSFHDLYRQHLIRSEYKNKMRPVLINNWEATYFNFDTEKLLDIARKAKENNIEMLVMDDGWFGKRNADNCSLGDWIVNEEKLKGGLNYLVSEVNKIGLKFGIWFEPEMISPDSDLYRAHPDWAIQISGREPGMSRQQYVLDITRKEVRDYAYNFVKKILNSANIEYVKWDMNRQLSDIGSAVLPADQMGEFYHRYVLAVYEMQERLVTDFPHLLLENCSGGGARFDPGMFYYSPQIWCSDDTDAIERLSIQEGTSLVYPLSTMGAHVSTCPNHACGRVTPFRTRGYVALSGTFGYELDITKISDDERWQIPGQVALYKKYSDLVRNGDYYRIASYTENHEYDCWMSLNKEKTQGLITFIQVMNHPNYKTRFIKIPGLDQFKTYTVSFPDEDQNQNPPLKMSGSVLTNCGIPIPRLWGDYQGRLIEIKAD